MDLSSTAASAGAAPPPRPETAPPETLRAAAPLPAPERPLPWYQRPITPRQGTALGLAGALLLALPLAQLLQQQAAELDQHHLLRASLDPLGAAAAVQAAVLEHRDASRLLLGGDGLAEPLRQVWQAEVDLRQAVLALMLRQGHWDKAAVECSAMAADWRELVATIEARRINVQASQRAHTLLVEQLIQVIDLATLAVLQGPAGSAATTANLGTAAQHLLHTWRQALARPGSSAAEASAVGAAVAAQVAFSSQQALRVQQAQGWTALALAALAACTLALLWARWPRSGAGMGPVPGGAALPAPVAEGTDAAGAGRSVLAVATAAAANPATPREQAHALIGRLKTQVPGPGIPSEPPDPSSIPTRTPMSPPTPGHSSPPSTRR